MPEENDALNEAQANATDGVAEPTGESTPTPYDELKSFMESRNLKSPDDLTGYVEDLGTTEQWKKHYGESRNEVGELRRELEALKAQSAQDPYGEQPVNIGDIVEQKVERVITRLAQQQQEASMKFMHERNELQSRPGWKDVQPHFDRALQDPQIQFALQNGRLTQEKLYSQINERVLLSRVNAYVNDMPKGALQQPPAAQDTADRVSAPVPDEMAKKERMAKAIENQDVDALLKDLLPDDDPILRF